jgi:hypothetical protein
MFREVTTCLRFTSCAKHVKANPDLIEQFHLYALFRILLQHFYNSSGHASSLHGITGC